jgi:hypothetical protein
MPGDVSRAHHGGLLLDELPEFRCHVLEVLRQPQEKSITKIQSPRACSISLFGRTCDARRLCADHYGHVRVLCETADDYA